MRYLLLTLCLFGLAFLPAGRAQCDFQTSTTPSAVSCFGGSNGAINLTVTNGAGGMNGTSGVPVNVILPLRVSAGDAPAKGTGRATYELR